MAHKRWGKCLTAAALAAMIALTSGISAPAWAESISELESQQESLQTRSGELNAALEEAKKNTEEKEALKQEYEDKISQDVYKRQAPGVSGQNRCAGSADRGSLCPGFPTG